MLMEFALKKFCVHTFVPQCAGGLPPRLPYNFIPTPSQYFHLSFFCSIGSWWPVLARFHFIVQMVIRLVLTFLYPDALETMSWYRTSRLYLQPLCHRGLLSLLILWGTCWSRCRNQYLYVGDIKILRGQWLLFPYSAAELDKQMTYGSAQLKMSWRGLSQEVLVSGCNFMSWVMALKILRMVRLKTSLLKLPYTCQCCDLVVACYLTTSPKFWPCFPDLCAVWSAPTW